MRKLWCTGVAVLLLVSGCSGSGDDTATPAPSAAAGALTGPGTDLAAGQLFAYTKTGTVRYDFVQTSTADGQTVTTTTGTVAVNGDRVLMQMSGDGAGELSNAKVIVADGFSYLIDDDAKQVVKQSGEVVSAQTVIAQASVGDMTPSETGTGSVGDQELPYWAYVINSATLYVFSAADTAYMESTKDDTTTLVVISNISSEVPDATFELPDGYQVVTAS